MKFISAFVEQWSDTNEVYFDVSAQGLISRWSEQDNYPVIVKLACTWS